MVPELWNNLPGGRLLLAMRLPDFSGLPNRNRGHRYGRHLRR